MCSEEFWSQKTFVAPSAFGSLKRRDEQSFRKEMAVGTRLRSFLYILFLASNLLSALAPSERLLWLSAVSRLIWMWLWPGVCSRSLSDGARLSSNGEPSSKNRRLRERTAETMEQENYKVDLSAFKLMVAILGFLNNWENFYCFRWEFNSLIYGSSCKKLLSFLRKLSKLIVCMIKAFVLTEKHYKSFLWFYFTIYNLEW